MCCFRASVVRFPQILGCSAALSLLAKRKLFVPADRRVSLQTACSQATDDLIDIALALLFAGTLQSSWFC
jgi:hypothetical protein